MKIIDVEGIGPVNAAKLKEVGVRTTNSLLKVAAHSRGRKELASATGISKKLILEWVNRADLMRVKGVGEEYSDLLEAAGVDTVKELRNRNPENLWKTLYDVNVEKRLVRRSPSLGEVKSWVMSAHSLEPVVTY